MAGENTLNDILYKDPNFAREQKLNESDPSTAYGNEYNYVLSFFKKIMKDDVAAQTFTDSLYEVSRFSNVPILELVETLKDQDKISVTKSMSFYLNSLRSLSTLLGVQNTIQPNFYVSRNALI